MRKAVARSLKVVLALIISASVSSGNAARTAVKRFIYQATFARRSDAEAFVNSLNSGSPFCEAGKQFGLSCHELELGEMTESRLADLSDATLAHTVFQVGAGRAVGPGRTAFGWQVIEAAEAVEGPWFPIGRSNTGMLFELDTRSVSGNDEFRKAWVRYTMASPKGAGDQTLSYEGFDCGGRRSVTIRSIRYHRGHVLGSGKTIPESIAREFLQPVVPDTVGETVYKLVCTFPASNVRPES